MQLSASLVLIFSLGASYIPATAQKAAQKTKRKVAASAPGLAELQKMAARLAPTPLRVDISRLSPGDRQALAKLIEAGRLLNPVFLKQYWSGNLALYARLQKDTSPLGKARLRVFWINKGPWSGFDDYRPFIPGVPAEKPPGSNFYPEDMTKQDFETWTASLPKEDQDQARSFFTVIRWKNGTRSASDGALVAIPYSEEYKDNLTRAADLLKEAAGLTENASLKNFLNLRADAFLSNTYHDSDLAWMDLDAPIDITIGPYETYNDQVFGYKAAFEVFVNLRDDEETRKFSVLSAHLQEIEDNLPLDLQYHNPQLGKAAPIRVVDEVLYAGDSNHGIATAAYNLPNDERIVQQRGSKRVMLRNVQEAKFRGVLLPIARRVLSSSAMIDVNFESFFNHIVAHELMHGLGPHQITVAGRDTTVRKELKELFGGIEEAKADVTGLFALQYMMDHAKEMHLTGVLPSDGAAQRQLYTTYLASMFRTLRFGLEEAHGKGMAIQFNYFIDHGAVAQRADGTLALDLEKVKQAVRDLDHDLLTLEAQGDYAAAKNLLDEMGVMRPLVRKAFDRLSEIPTDIQQVFVTADELAPEKPEPAAQPAAKKKSRRRH
jgi:Peptidase family M49